MSTNSRKIYRSYTFKKKNSFCRRQYLKLITLTFLIKEIAHKFSVNTLLSSGIRKESLLSVHYLDVYLSSQESVITYKSFIATSIGK